MDKKVKNIIKQIKENYKPKTIILFGSRAIGTENESSDVDLILIKNTKKRFNLRSVEVLEKIDYDLDLDIFVYTPSEIKKMKKENNLFITNAINTGVEV